VAAATSLLTVKLIIHPAARKEFDRKVEYLRQKGLLPNSAELFVDEIECALEEIKKHPGKNRMRGATNYFRVGPTEHFSYSLIYQIRENTVEVIAIAAPQRRPDYWKRRRI
jgi:mRNA-degrading endonuclease RelE of RelBE toxin-antitoxin system